jgi:aminopeptidase
MKENFLEATRNILEKNLNILDEPFVQNKLVLVYDKNSKLSVLLSESYISNLENYKNLDIELIDFDEVDKEELKNKLLSLKENSTVILVQSTNFRLDNFRIRLNLHNS